MNGVSVALKPLNGMHPLKGPLEARRDVAGGVGIRGISEVTPSDVLSSGGTGAGEGAGRMEGGDEEPGSGGAGAGAGGGMTAGKSKSVPTSSAGKLQHPSNSDSQSASHQKPFLNGGRNSSSDQLFNRKPARLQSIRNTKQQRT